VRVSAVIKVGGSLLDTDALPGLLEALAALAREAPIVVVPGGGRFADAVREACAHRDPGETAAHFMAILAMDQYAHYLEGLAGDLILVRDEEGIAGALAAGALPVLAPHAWLRAEDPLPHSWSVTSDSLAAWLAGRLEARLVLIKAVDGVPDGSGGIALRVRKEDAGDLVDSYLPEALGEGRGCWIVNGHHPERVAELLRTGTTRGTELL
jgi:aspartokinase-like uncharacterized kinase